MKKPASIPTKKNPAERKVAQSSFPTVAIGASAGGLEAITELLKNLPSDTGMAFIYVQHLSPDHKSLLTPILSKATSMKVQEIDHMDKIKPDNLFVIPYNKGIEVTDGHIKLVPRAERSSPNSIDNLFTSLAEAQKERVIGIILSGSASDGTLGMKAIKQEGGLTFAQDDSAKFPSMPRSAIASGAVDFILSPKEIALELARLSKHPFAGNKEVKPGQENSVPNSDPDLKSILNLLHKVRGVDFSQYKMNTVKRRIGRRMLLYKIKTLGEYARLLHEKAEEPDILYQDLLINVTNFFRDTDAHKYLKSTLFPKLFKTKRQGDRIRIWVPACSTGEEAFSLAMLLVEVQDNQAENIPVQVFATDLSEKAISKARIGIYNKEDLEAVSPKRIQRFFTKTDNKFRIAKSIRDICVFAPHNILSDPPFSRLDFISCCNLFIYLDIAAQKRALGTFHYALNPGGYLMLGKSETISSSADLFTGVNKKFKIFSRKKSSGMTKLPVLSPGYTRPSAPPENLPGNMANNPVAAKKRSARANGGLDSVIDAVLVAGFMPASVVINYEMDVQQFRGSTDLYLTHAAGKATFNILKMVRPEIAFELRSAISKSIKTKQRVRKSEVEMKWNATHYLVSIEVVPLNIEWDEPLLLILFSEKEQVENFNRPGEKNTSPAKDRRIKKLEEELALAREDALAFSREQQEFTEELQSANEEVVSSNEELQTINEELETSKEEIESVNEELITTNQELQTRNDLLNESYDYIEAISATINESMIVLDKSLHVKSANKSFYKVFGVTEEETEGEILYNLGNKQWNIPRLRELLEDIIPRNAHFHDFEVTHTFPAIGEKTMLLNATRIIRKTHGEELLLLTIQDITEIRQKTLELQRKELVIHAKEITKKNAEKVKLEKAVEERTRELEKANGSLEGKNAELQKMNKELESFTYISSHDLQEPIRKIQTFAGMILEKEHQHLSDKGKNYFLLIQKSADRMRMLIQDLLAFSRLGTQKRKFEKTSLAQIVEEVQQNLKDAIIEKHAIIEVGEMCEASIIPFQFLQLMHNLISNALKFSTPNRPPHIVIKSRVVKSSKGNADLLPGHKQCCHITVSDNGIGFEQKFGEQIFEVFQRLHNKDDYSGTGIGLAIVKKVVENHNGVITATGTLNKGASFDIYIPVR